MTHTERENITIWQIILVVAAIFAFLMTTVAIDTSGRKDWNHREALPANVAQLSQQAYLIGPKARIAPPQICRGGDNNGNPIKTTREVPALGHALYIECERDQTWSDGRAKSINFTHAMGRALVAPAWWLTVFIVFVIANIYTAYVLAERLVERRRVRKAQKAEHKKNVVNAEDKRKELAAAYAAGDIDDAAFEQGLNRIYDLVPRRKS